MQNYTGLYTAMLGYTGLYNAVKGDTCKFKFKFILKIIVKFNNEHYTHIAMLIEACSVMAYTAMNLLR